MIIPKAFNLVPEDVIISGFAVPGSTAPVAKVTSETGGFDFVIGASVTGPSVTGSTGTSGHVDMARPSQAIPVSHSSSVTTALSPKKS